MVSTAARVGSINVLLAVQMGQAMQGLYAFASNVERTGQRTQRAVGGIDRSVLGMNRSLAAVNSRGFTGVAVGALRARDAIDQLRGLALAAGVAVGGLVPAAVASGMIRLTDTAHRMSNQLRTVTNSTVELKNVQDELFAVAQRSRAGFESTAIIYARTARATEHLGLSQQKLLRITETIQKAFAVGGATTAEAWGAAVQLSQGIASNRFSGEEFRSVAENAPVLLQGMARSLGVNIGKLREMAHAGELTAEVVTKAILDATQDIEEGFAKTTSTIEQAWVKVGNAALKYAMDSKQASAASVTIVSVLNGITENIDTVADSLVLLGGTVLSIMAGRPLNAIRQNAAAMGVMRAEAVAATQAQMQLAAANAAAMRSEWISKRLAFNKALADGNLTAKQLERQKNALAASTRRYHDAVAAAAIATQRHDAALKAASTSGRAFAAVGGAARAAWSFIGGPFGAALLAIGGVMYLQAQRAAAAQERTERYADAIRKAGDESNGAAGGIRAAAEALFAVAENATRAGTAASLANAKANELAGIRQLFHQLEEAGIRGGWAFRQSSDALQELAEQFRSGSISAEEFVKKTDDIARRSPDYVQAYIAGMQDAARETDAARGEVAALEDAIARLDGKTATVKIDVVTGLKDLGTGEKGNRLGATPMDLATEDALRARLLAARSGWEEIFPKLFKEPKQSRGGSRKTADDQFDNLIQGVRDRIAALQEEQIALGLNYREQERRKIALELEQQALRKVREEARRKGEQDWQNAQLSPEQVKAINEVADAYSQEADELRRLTEQMEFRKDMIRGVLGDIYSALDDGKITIEEWGDIFINVIDKVANKLMDDLVDALFQVNNAGRGGGGFLSSIFGGLFGGGTTKFAGEILSGARVGLFDSGGVHLGSNIVPFGPKTKKLGAGMIADSGLGPRHFLSVLEQGEAVLTDDLMSRTMNVIGSAADALKDGGRGGGRLEVEIYVRDDGTLGAIAREAGAEAGAAQVRVYDQGRLTRLSKDIPELRKRGALR